tara:strand:- start:2447 stop:2635 length:189 start_codon:yes stop_codon:yes gene_type:complete
MEHPETILWGHNAPEPKYARSEEHRKFMIATYNKNRPKDKQVRTMAELNRALLTEEIKALKK